MIERVSLLLTSLSQTFSLTLSVMSAICVCVLLSGCPSSDSNTSGESSMLDADSSMSDPSMSDPSMRDDQGSTDLSVDHSMELGGEEISGGELSMPDEPWLTLGTGFRRFEPLSSGMEVPIIAGIQGGFHVWGAFKGQGFNDQDITLLFQLFLEGELIADANYFEFELPTNSAGEFEYSGVSVIYFENERVEPSSGKEMLLTLDVLTQDGVTLSDEILLRPVCCM